MNIILCGMPCSGKTYYGKIAAKLLGWDFIDTDEMVLLEYYRRYAIRSTCREIVLAKGINFFRAMEKEAVLNLEKKNCTVVATGGGILCLKENAHVLKKNGRLIYLKTSSEILLSHIKKKALIPTYLDENNIEGSFHFLFKKRVPLYENYCDDILDTSIQNVIEFIQNCARKDKYYGK